MQFLLDTNAVSEFWKATRGTAEPGFIRWATAAIPESLYLSAVTILEFEIGLLSLERRDPVQARPMRRWFENLLLVEFSERILPVDLPVVRKCAALHVPNRKPERDSHIAATALVHNMTVVTRNIRDFEPTGVRILNPWALQS